MVLPQRKKSLQEQSFLILIASVAALGGFLFGYDTGLISGALVFIRQTYPVSTFLQEVIVSSVLLGALLSSIFSGRLADIFGRKSILICMGLTFLVGTVLTTFAPNIYILILGRFIIGVAIGITSYTSPLFISEIAPTHKRGALVLLNGIMITGGEAIAFLVDYFLVPTQSWRLMFATGLIPAVLFFLGMCLLPSSPRWLVLMGRVTAAREILNKIRSKHEVEPELSEIMQSVKGASGAWSELFSKFMRPVLFIGMGLGICQQFIGINTVMYYGPAIFQSAGMQSDSAQILATFGMGLVNTLMTVVAVIIVDKVGRRTLLLSGISMAGVSLAFISLIFYLDIHNLFFVWSTIVLMMIYIAGCSLSLGSLFWLVISEIYPLNIRGLAMSLVTSTQWAANYLVALTFLSMLNGIGPVYTFWLYSFMCVISFMFCYYLVPETQGVSLEQIEKNLRMGKHPRELGQPLRAER